MTAGSQPRETRSETTSGMKATNTALPGVLVIEPVVHADARGSFFEAWERDRYAHLGLPVEWRQENVVHSTKGVLRGLHLQHPNAQYKLISVLVGSIFDVAVDVRRGSPTFGKWEGAELSAANHLQLAVPEGFAHGYLVLSDAATVMYKCSRRYDPKAERVLRWDDPDVAIEWPTAPTAIAERDRAGLLLRDFAPGDLPEFAG